MTENLSSLLRDKQNLKTYLGRNILKLSAEISAFGVRPVYETDFDSFRETMIALPDRGSLTGIFDPSKCTIGPNNGFWIRGVNDAGNTVHAQAMRYDDLDNSTLADQWQQNADLFSPAGLDVNIEKSSFDTAPASHKITGGVCYHGDFWMDRSARKFGLAPILAQFAMLLALIRFDPDYIYGLVVPKNIKKGWAAQQGYLHSHPWAPRWHIEKDGEDSSDQYDDYLVWITGQELDELWRSGERNGFVADRIRQTHQSGRPIVENAAGQ